MVSRIDDLTEQLEIAAGRRAPYTQLGDWVALSGTSSQAKALYWHLSMHINQKRGDFEVWPTREVLAEWCGFTRPQSVDQYLEELVALDAIEIRQERYGTNRMRKRNVYIVHQEPPEDYSGPRSLKEFYAARKGKPAGHPEVRHTASPEVRHTASPEVRHTAHKPHEPQLDEEKPPHRACAREDASHAPEVGGGGNSHGNGGGGVLAMVGEIADAMAVGSSTDTGEEQRPPSSMARALLERLRARDGSGLSGKALREFEPLAARLLEHHAADDIDSHLTNGINTGGGIRYRLTQLSAGKTTITPSPRQTASSSASPDHSGTSAANDQGQDETPKPAPEFDSAEDLVARGLDPKFLPSRLSVSL